MERHTFLAVPIPSSIQEKIEQFALEIRPILPMKKWTGNGDYHITVSFLGPTSEDRLHTLTKNLSTVSISHHPFQLKLNRPGVFGNRSTPRVFWIGIEQSSELEMLQKDVVSACQQVGFTIETRPYRPHITIAKRWNGTTGTTVDLDAFPSSSEFQELEWQVDELVLYEIRPGQKPMYQPIHSFKLGRVDNR